MDLILERFVNTVLGYWSRWFHFTKHKTTRGQKKTPTLSYLPLVSSESSSSFCGVYVMSPRQYSFKLNNEAYRFASLLPAPKQIPEINQIYLPLTVKVFALIGVVTNATPEVRNMFSTSTSSHNIYKITKLWPDYTVKRSGFELECQCY